MLSYRRETALQCAL